ncbi:TPA: Cna B-type domain-containing protein, partial [Streptococcus pyogenes]|nr:Cna B-type domain-containing protein [Streptococcus pyogenes]
KNLKKYNGTGNDIIYSVKEVTVPTGYDVTYSANDIINTKREVITQQGPNLEIEETLPLESGASGGTTTVEDSRPVDTLSGLSSEQGQSGSKIIDEDTLTSFKGKKIWKNDTAENRPQAIQVQLYADGVAVEGQTKFISGSGNEWSFEF